MPVDPPAIVRPAPACDAAARARILAPPSPGDDGAALACSLRLAPGEAIRRRVAIEGSRASGVTLDCAGGTIGEPGAPAYPRAYTVAVRSLPPPGPEGRWDRPSDVTIENCRIHGHVRVWGQGENGQGPLVRESSHRAGHTLRAQEAAPTRVTIRRTIITAAGPIPLYLGPGVTRFALEGSRLDGRSVATALYLDAESAENRIEGNEIATATDREAIAVDGSARNRIVSNRFDLGRQGAVRLYRNCGEGGTVRHQAPSDNVVFGNVFAHSALIRWPAVIVNSRMGLSRWCGDDDGYPFGSSASNLDGGTGNVVEGNEHR